MRYRARKNDETWQVSGQMSTLGGTADCPLSNLLSIFAQVSVDELHFDDPVEVIGQGSFGVVWLAEYRGTKVAIKRAVKNKTKSKRSKRSGSGARSHQAGNSMTLDSSMPSVPSADEEAASIEDEENQASGAVSTSTGSKGSSHDRSNSNPTGSGSNLKYSRSGSRDKSGNHFSLGFLADEYGHFSRHWYKPFSKKRGYRGRFRDSILGDSLSSSLRTKTMYQRCCPWFDEQSRKEAEFLTEMRVLSRLRHPW